MWAGGLRSRSDPRIWFSFSVGSLRWTTWTVIAFMIHNGPVTTEALRQFSMIGWLLSIGYVRSSVPPSSFSDPRCSRRPRMHRYVPALPTESFSSIVRFAPSRSHCLALAILGWRCHWLFVQCNAVTHTAHYGYFAMDSLSSVQSYCRRSYTLLHNTK